MLDNLKNLANLPGIMARAKELQERMAAMQGELASRIVEGEAGAGLVKATVSGKLELQRLQIDRSRLGVSDASGKTAMGQSDIEMLEDLIVAAVASAQAKAAEMIKSEMARVASESGIPAGMMPGM